MGLPLIHKVIHKVIHRTTPWHTVARSTNPPQLLNSGIKSNAQNQSTCAAHHRAAAFACEARGVACYSPLRAFRSRAGDVTFDSRLGDTDLKLPCGQCVGCRLARARQWSLRCVHEAALHKENCFITLTYSPQSMPPGGTLNYRDFQLFLKRLRKRMAIPIRYFVVGEYGEQLSRPHYHACMFGLDFPDKTPVTYLSKPGSWRSKLLEDTWSLGHTHLGQLNVRSAAYAARYCLKKITGQSAKIYYTRVDDDGVMHTLQPEFARMSLRPGVGAHWFHKYRADLSGDYVVHEGSKYGVPRYYDRLRERDNPQEFAQLKEDRELRALPFASEHTPERLATRELVEKAKIANLKRQLENR